MILCDTNIFIEVYKNNSTIISVLEKIGQERIAASQVTSGELVFGALNKRELAAIHSDLQKIRMNGGKFSFVQCAKNENLPPFILIYRKSE